jgi:hypothetical protein
LDHSLYLSYKTRKYIGNIPSVENNVNKEDACYKSIDRGKVMDRNMFIKKSLVIPTIFFLITVSIAPVVHFNVVKASDDNDLVEISTKACGIRRSGDSRVTLTKEQYRNLEKYLVEFKTRLNQTTTHEEAVSIFKEAVVELDKYGLLPRGMSTTQAQRLVTMGQQIQQIVHRMSKSIGSTVNVFCLFTAISDNVVDFNIWVVAAAMLSQVIHYDSPFILLVYLLFFIGFVKPLRFLNVLTVDGGGEFSFYFSLGLKGVDAGLDGISTVIGFTGLKITLNAHNAFYLGVAGFIT